MSTSTRVTRSKGESDRLSLPTRTRSTRKETKNTTFNAGQDQQQQMPTQTPQLPTQSPQANPVRRTETPAPMLPPGPHRPLTPVCLFPHHQLLVHSHHGHLPLCSKKTSTAQPQKKKQKWTQK